MQSKWLPWCQMNTIILLRIILVIAVIEWWCGPLCPKPRWSQRMLVLIMISNWPYFAITRWDTTLSERVMLLKGQNPQKKPRRGSGNVVVNNNKNNAKATNSKYNHERNLFCIFLLHILYTLQNIAEHLIILFYRAHIFCKICGDIFFVFIITLFQRENYKYYQDVSKSVMYNDIL